MKRLFTALCGAWVLVFGYFAFFWLAMGYHSHGSAEPSLAEALSVLMGWLASIYFLGIIATFLVMLVGSLGGWRKLSLTGVWLGHICALVYLIFYFIIVISAGKKGDSLFPDYRVFFALVTLLLWAPLIVLHRKLQ